MSRRFVRWSLAARNLPPAALRTECETQLAREQKLGKLTSGFSQGLHAVQALLEQGLPSPAALGTFDGPTRAALLSIAERLAATGGIPAALLDRARAALGAPRKAGKRFRRFVERTKALPPHELRTSIDLEITNLEAQGDKGRYWANL